MKKTILASVIATLLSTTAMADTASMNPDVAGMGILQNIWIRAGVNGTSGTFGSGGSTTPGLLFDPTGTGTFNPSYDYLTPGSPFDGFSVKIDGTNYTNNNQGGNQITGDGNGLTLGTNSLSWTGGVAGAFNITNTYSLGVDKPYIDATASITMGTAASNVYFGKFIDPDSQGMPGDSSATDNVLGYGVIPSTNVAFSEATVSRYALGIYTTDSNVTAGINGWSTQADGYNGTNYFKPLLDADGNVQWTDPGCTNAAWGCDFVKELDADGNPIRANYGTSDDTIGISWHWTSVSAGDILTASYAYIFGPSAFEAASDAVTGGAGGGADVSSWGTLTDVGSATDAASSGSTGGSGGTTTPEPVITTETVVNTSLPVLTASITHHEASDNGKVQTIDREKTETVTTAMVTNTYTDGVLTSSVAADPVVETTVTNPASFVGRIDQMSIAQHMQNMAVRNLSFNGVNIIAENTTNGNTQGFAIGGNKELDNGMFVGAGVGQLTTNASNVDGKATANTTVVNLRGGKHVDIGTVTMGVTHGMTDLTASRTIGDFANTSATSGTDTSVGVQFVGNGERVRPVVGYTSGVRSVDGYTESGSIQSARVVQDSTENYSYATVGAQLTLVPGVEAQVLHHTDGVNVASLNIVKEWDKNKTFMLGASRSMSDQGDSNSIRAGIQIKF